MTIQEETPITMSEVASLAGDSEKGRAIQEFIKKFTTMPAEKAIQMKKELQELDLIKLKESHIVKIVDFTPENASELNKILVDVSLDPEEISKILDVVGKY